MNPYYQPGYSYANNPSGYQYGVNNFAVPAARPVGIEAMYSNVQPYASK